MTQIFCVWVLLYGEISPVAARAPTGRDIPAQGKRPVRVAPPWVKRNIILSPVRARHKPELHTMAEGIQGFIIRFRTLPISLTDKQKPPPASCAGGGFSFQRQVFTAYVYSFSSGNGIAIKKRMEAPLRLLRSSQSTTVLLRVSFKASRTPATVVTAF